MESVQNWCKQNQYKYKLLDDSLFALIDPKLVEKAGSQKVIATDLARLYAIKEELKSFERLIWLDADFLIFAPNEFNLPKPAELPEGYMLGREIWIQADAERPQKLKAYTKVHNAFLLFDRGNSFLEFYLQHAERLLNQCQGPMPPQFIGPKLLTALHNVIQCPVFEPAGMLSPMVIDDLLSKNGQCCAVNLMKKRSTQPIAGANLCRSLVGIKHRSNKEMDTLVKGLIEKGNPI